MPDLPENNEPEMSPDEINRLRDEHAKLTMFLETFLITFDIVPVDIPCQASRNLISQARELLESISQAK
ncbi:MAG: hypothetical protein AB7C90_04315 [Bacteroidales bacterium]